MFRSPDHFPPRQMAANRLIWMVLIMTGGIDMALVHFYDMQLTITYKPLFIYLFCVCAGISLFYRLVAHEKALFLLGECIAQLICASFVVMVTASLGVAFSFLKADDTLQMIDHVIGFDWLEHAYWMTQHSPLISDFLRFCYNSYGFQLALLIPAIFFYHHSDYGQRLVMMFFISFMLAALLSALFPAEGVYMHLGIDPASFAPITPAAPLLHKEYFVSLRDGGTTIIFPSLALGSFPATHAILAVMLIYASIPLERLRWLIIPLNICMVIATFFHGGHYLVDVITGIVVAFVGIYVAERILPPRSQASSAFLNQLATEEEKLRPFS